MLHHFENTVFTISENTQKSKPTFFSIILRMWARESIVFDSFVVGVQQLYEFIFIYEYLMIYIKSNGYRGRKSSQVLTKPYQSMSSRLHEQQRLGGGILLWKLVRDSSTLGRQTSLRSEWQLCQGAWTLMLSSVSCKTVRYMLE